MVNTIDPNLLLSSLPKKERKASGDILGKDDFLKILMTQLKNQDPSNPMQDREFIAQMAQFSTLEQMTNMNSSIEKLVQLQSQSSLISFNEFIGKTVTWHEIVESKDPLKDPVINTGKGTVKSVQFKGDAVKIVLEDGKELIPANISEVHSRGAETPLIQASHLIGKKVTWSGSDDSEGSGLVQSVSMKDGVLWVQLAGGERIETNQIKKIE